MPQLVAKLLYGSGLRLMEALRLRVQDMDFGIKQLTVRDGQRQVHRVAGGGHACTQRAPGASAPNPPTRPGRRRRGSVSARGTGAEVSKRGGGFDLIVVGPREVAGGLSTACDRTICQLCG